MIGLHLVHPLAAAGGVCPAKLGQLVSQGPQASSSLLIQQHQHQHQLQEPNIVRIAAKTAPPIVGEVRRRKPKVSRSEPPIIGNGQLDASSQQVLHPIILGENCSSLRSRKTAQKGSPIIKMINKQAHNNQQQFRDNNFDHDNRVLLIVNDDHIKGGGIPILGRRLPSKSMSPANEHCNYMRHKSDHNLNNTVIDYSMQPPAIQVDSSAMIFTANAPVIGRRSHRMQQQQQAQQQHRLDAIYQYNEESSLQSGERYRKLTEKSHHHHHQQQPLNILDARQQQQQHIQLHIVKLTESNQQGKPKQKQSRSQKQPVVVEGRAGQSGSQNSLAEQHLPVIEYSLPPMQKRKSAKSAQLANCRSSRSQQQQQQHQLQRMKQCRSMASLVGLTSASMSSQQSDLSSYSGAGKTCACCSSASTERLHFRLAEGGCREACCIQYDESESHYEQLDGSLARSASCQRVPTCCDMALMKQSSPLLDSSQRHSQEHAHKSHSQHNHHSKCRANLTPNNHQLPVYPRPDLEMCSQQQPMLISGRNVLPVHPKPPVHKIAQTASNLLRCSSASAAGKVISNHSSNNSHKCHKPPGGRSKRLAEDLAGGQVEGPQEDEAAAVTQMYESLAAELKAKLGDPRVGPILLPPKDYDTMSRQQGKLTGIELRRSTNPMLVGPAATKLISSNESSLTINELEEPICSATRKPIRNSKDDEGRSKKQSQKSHSSTSGSVCESSSRGSGRSCRDNDTDYSAQVDGDLSTLQRSRSNSSSGLGSVSMGASSPQSPPSSSESSASSEDMHCQLAQLQSAERANWNGRFEIPLKVNSEKNGNTYLATKQIIY